MKPKSGNTFQQNESQYLQIATYELSGSAVENSVVIERLLATR